MSDARFADGLRYRIEIPSVEGPEVLRAVLEEADTRGVPVRRVSQGSGVMMLTDGEIAEMAALGAERGVEISLFLGPRGAWDAGGQSFATAAVGGVARAQAARRLVGRGGAARGRARHPFGARRRRGCPRDARAAEAGRRAAGGARPQDVRAAAVREPADGAGVGGPRRVHDQRQHRSLGRPTWARSGRPARRRSTSTSKCPTTRAASCASTRSPR